MSGGDKPITDYFVPLSVPLAVPVSAEKLVGFVAELQTNAARTKAMAETAAVMAQVSNPIAVSHSCVQCALALNDDISMVKPSSASARRVVDLVKEFGRPYAAGELSERRNDCITGSSVPALCGECMPFQPPNLTYLKLACGWSTPDNANMAWGRLYESVALFEFRKQQKCKLFFTSFITDAKYPWIGGTPDALAIMPNGEGVLLEVKCPKERCIGSGKIPSHYLGQVQTYLMITGLQSCLFVQYKPSFVTPKKSLQRPMTLKYVEVKYDPSYMLRRLPLLWHWFCSICAFKVAYKPVAQLAANLIGSYWLAKSKSRYDPEFNRSIKRFNRERSILAGLFKVTFLEMMTHAPSIPPASSVASSSAIAPSMPVGMLVDPASLSIVVPRQKRALSPSEEKEGPPEKKIAQ